MQIHQKHNIDLELASSLKEDKLTDHAHIDGLGSVKTSFYDTEDTWFAEFTSKDSYESEIFYILEKNIILNSRIGQLSLLFEFNLRNEDIQLLDIPIDFFASENQYLEYPTELFNITSPKR